MILFSIDSTVVLDVVQTDIFRLAPKISNKSAPDLLHSHPSKGLPEYDVKYLLRRPRRPYSERVLAGTSLLEKARAFAKIHPIHFFGPAIFGKQGVLYGESPSSGPL